jgi:hypothetical protein
MSEIRLNLVDSTSILSGTIHGSYGDRCVAALSAEPETILELEAALERFEKDPLSFYNSPVFGVTSEIDERPYDAGLLIIDLAARIVVCDSTYSCPGPNGLVVYHNGNCATETPIFYQLPDDWLFLQTIDDYHLNAGQRREARLATPLDAREVLYGRPLLEFLATAVRYTCACQNVTIPASTDTSEEPTPTIGPIGLIHAQWLLTPRADLRNQSPREVLLAKQNFISRDLESRAHQWSMLLEGPPCLSKESFAYRYAGFGFHEWVLYYNLIRYLLGKTFGSTGPDNDFESLVLQLDQLRNSWLNEPNDELEGHIAAIIIDNERRRLPEAMGGRSMVIDEDCPICKMMGDECEAGLEVCFWHLDGSHMDQHFAFSTFATEQEYLEDLIQNDLRHREFDRHWKEREEKIARGEKVESDPIFDASGFDEFFPYALAEAEPPEA